MADIQLRNKSHYEFTDISSEKYRTYVFDNYKITIDNPQFLAISKNGHRLIDNNEICYYIPSGWRYIYWQVKDHFPHFVK